MEYNNVLEQQTSSAIQTTMLEHPGAIMHGDYAFNSQAMQTPLLPCSQLAGISPVVLESGPYGENDYTCVSDIMIRPFPLVTGGTIIKY